MPLHRVDPDALAATAAALTRLRDGLLEADDDLLTQHVLLGARSAEDEVLDWLDGVVDAARAIGEAAREVGLGLREVGTGAARAESEVTALVVDRAE
jgi:hypothetical protein